MFYLNFKFLGRNEIERIAGDMVLAIDENTPPPPPPPPKKKKKKKKKDKKFQRY